MMEKDEKDIWADYDPEKARLALLQSAGALEGVDREELMRDIHLARQPASYGRPEQGPLMLCIE